MATWYELVHQARRGTKLSRQALAELSGVSPETVYSYEHNRRSPSRENLIRLAEAMKLDSAATNQILEAAGLDPIPSAWLRKAVLQRRSLDDLPAELELYSWPCLAYNERFEIVGWNRAAVVVAELDFATALPQPHQRNLLRIGAMKHLRDRLLNWEEVLGILMGWYKNYHMGNEDLLGESSPYFQSILADIQQYDSEAFPLLMELWEHTPPRPHASRTVWKVDWKTGDGARLTFNCVNGDWDEFDAVAMNDWHPADCTTWEWLSARL